MHIQGHLVMHNELEPYAEEGLNNGSQKVL